MIFHQAGNSLANYNYNTSFYTDTVWEHHFHKNPEIICVLEGAVRCTVNGENYRLAAGEFGLCLPYEIHRYQPEENSRYWVIVFSEDYVRLFAKQMVGKRGDRFGFRCELAVEQYVRAQLIENPAPSTFTLKSCLYALCGQYLNAVRLRERDGKEFRAISSVSEYIRQNHTNKISLSEIAEKLGYDYNYMSRFFRNIFNMTFTEFVNIYRLETALDLLENTDKSITAVALESGFQSVRTFNHFFKNNTGKTPTEYRKAVQQTV
ncbi:MAG: helix-turn-helix transcriptional regulator [Clostridia bacterium]|nr:helix-turn-helix transcriptional regulator [Clostridia bacterium]